MQSGAFKCGENDYPRNDINVFVVDLVEAETVTVKVWHLRPSLIWSDGQWSEFCRTGDNRTSQVYIILLALPRSYVLPILLLLSSIN